MVLFYLLKIFRKHSMRKKIVITILFVCVNLISAQIDYFVKPTPKYTNENLEFISQWKTSGSCKSSFVMGEYAYITNNNKLEIIDVSDPELPNLVSQAELTSSFNSEDIVGIEDYVFLANYNTVYTFDVSDPMNPDSVNAFVVESIINDIHVVQNNLYLIASYDFYILDISDPSNITELGKISLPEASLGLTRFHIEENYAYLGSWSDGLYIIDISNSTNPVLYGRFLETSYICVTQGNFAYVSNSKYLYILDISDKVIPEIIDRRQNIQVPHDIIVDDNYIYAAADRSIIIYSKEDLGYITSYPIQDISERVQIDADFIYLSSNSEGLNILQFDNTTNIKISSEYSNALSMDQNYPNPFNPSTTIKYTIPRTNMTISELKVQLKVFDISGKEVLTLVNKKQSPGNYEVKFSPDKISSGVYLYRLSVGKNILSKKMLFVK